MRYPTNHGKITQPPPLLPCLNLKPPLKWLIPAFFEPEHITVQRIQPGPRKVFDQSEADSLNKEFRLCGFQSQSNSILNLVT